MSRKIFVIGLKVIVTLVLVYSAFMIVFISIFDLLSMSVNISFNRFLIEEIIPHASAVVALIFLLDTSGLRIRRNQILLKEIDFVP